MLHVVRTAGQGGVALAYPEIDPRTGELVHFVAVTAQGFHAREVASETVARLLVSVADPAAWHDGPAAMVRHALASVEPMTVHGGVAVSTAVAIRKGHSVEVAFSGDLQIRLASAGDSRWHVPGVKHGDPVTAVTYTPRRGDMLVIVTLGILEEIPPQELLSTVLSSEHEGGAALVEARVSSSRLPHVFCATRYGGPALPKMPIPVQATRRKVRWSVVGPAALVLAALGIAGAVWKPWTRAQPQRQAPRVTAPRPPAPLPRMPDTALASEEAVASADTLGEVVAADTVEEAMAMPSSTPGELVWKQRIGGSNFSSSPALAGMKVYVGSKDGHLYCLLSSSGEVLWKFKTGGGIGSSPAVDGASVYFGSYDSTFYCVDRHAGREIWSARVGASIGASPLVHEGAVYCGCKDGRVYAWDGHSGLPRWQLETKAEVWARPLAVGSHLFIGSLDRRFYCVDAETGMVVWSIEVAGAVYTSAAAGPENTVIFAANDGTVYQVHQRDGAVVWTGTFQPIYSSPLVANGMLFFGCTDGDVHCVSLKEHREVWKYTTGAAVRSSPTLAAGTLLVGSYDGRLYAFAVSGKRKWAHDTESRIYSTPAIGAQRAYFGDMTGWFRCVGM